MALAAQVCGAAPLSLAHVEAASWPLVPSLILGYSQRGHTRATQGAAGVTDAGGLLTEVSARPTRV